MSSIVISADALLDFFGALSLSNKGNNVYIYSGRDEIGDEPGVVTTLKGLATNEENTFFGSYVVEAESNSLEEFYLTAESIALIENLVYLINENCAPDEEDVAEEDSDEDFYVAVKLSFVDDNETGDTKITISPATGDADVDRKFGGFLTQSNEENLTDEFPAHQIARVIRGEGLSDAPNFVDREDHEGNPIPVPDGSVTVWDYNTKSPLHLALAKARSMKMPLAIEKHHASRIHGVRIGENWFGAIAPIPLNKADLSDQLIFADSESLNAEYDFTGLRDEDKVDLVEPTQEPDEYEDEEYEDEEYDDVDVDEEAEADSEDDDQLHEDEELSEPEEEEDNEEEAEHFGLTDSDEEDADDDEEEEDDFDEDAELARMIAEEEALLNAPIE